MHSHSIERYQHDHAYGGRLRHAGERRTWWVIAITVVMMAVEIATGLLYGSMALLADGWHMGTHAAALGITVFAYMYARRHADNPRYSFGTGKVGALGGFASAVALAVVSLFVLLESVLRLAEPVAIHFDEAIAVAAVGLVVNLVSAAILGGADEGHGHGHGHGHGEHRDHNLRGAYMHVLADALTSVFAIAALVAGKWLGWRFMDPIMGVVGAFVIARWSLGLLRDTSRVLLDAEISQERLRAITRVIEDGGDDRVADLHLWRVGPQHLAAIVSVVSHNPKAPDHYKQLLCAQPDLVHVTVEVHPCEHITG